MDIASVYLNLASLLDTEIEVEGYYAWGTIHADQDHPSSLDVALSDYVLNHVIPLDDRNIFPYNKPLIYVKGVLKINSRGNPLLDDLTEIVCVIDEGCYRATFTHRASSILCDMQADLSLNATAPWPAYPLIRDLTPLSTVLSKPIALEGFMDGPRQHLWLMARDVVANPGNYLIATIRRYTYATLFQGFSRLCRDRKSRVWRWLNERWQLRDVYYKNYTNVLMSYAPQESSYMERRFGTRYGGQGPRLDGATMTIYGQIGRITQQDRQKKREIRRYIAFKFTSIDHISIRKTITIDLDPPPQTPELIRHRNGTISHIT